MKKQKIIIAGPCSAENYAQLHDTACSLLENTPVNFIRCGVWKPRSRPGGFEGMGTTALEWIAQIKKEIPQARFVVEVATPLHVDLCLKYGIDAVWLGARTTCNPFSVQNIAKSLSGIDIPVFVKNPTTPDLRLWLGAIERVRTFCNNVSTVHRGFCTPFSGTFRNSPLWFLTNELRSHIPDIPILCDPSHITGSSLLINEVAQAAMSMDFDGLMVECHISPSNALTDANQQLTPMQFKELIENVFHATETNRTDIAEKIIQSELATIENEIHRIRIINNFHQIEKKGEAENLTE